MAAWVSLSRKWDWRSPRNRGMVAFEVGMHYMTGAQADEAVRVGAGTLVTRPDGGKVTKAGKVQNGS